MSSSYVQWKRFDLSGDLSRNERNQPLFVALVVPTHPVTATNGAVGTETSHFTRLPYNQIANVFRKQIKVVVL